MALNNLRNYNDVVESATNAEVKDQDIVELIVLKVGLIKSLEDELAVLNQSQRELGAPELPASHKLCGVSVTVAVYANGSNKIKYDRPKFNLKKDLNFYPPRTCYDKNYNFQNKGGSNKISMFHAHTPIAVDLYPSAFEAKDFNTGLTATQIREQGLTEQYAAIIENENLRNKEWEELLLGYKEATPAEATEFLFDGFSRKWFLCHIDGQNVKYIYPAVGTRFTAKWITRLTKEGKTMPDIYPLEWNKNTRNFDVYSKCNVKTATDDDMMSALAIKKVFDEYVPKAKPVKEESKF